MDAPPLGGPHDRHLAMPEHVDTVIIVGTGHCGTTFLCHVLMEAGCDFGQGEPPANWTLGDQAMEHPFLQDCVWKVTKALWDDEAGLPDLTRVEEVAEAHRDLIALAVERWPPFMKNPVLGLTLPAWTAGGLRPRGAIVCYRPLDQVLGSIMRRGGGYGALARFEHGPAALHRLAAVFGMTMDAILQAEIPLALVPFPDSVDPVYAPRLYYEITRLFQLPITEGAFIDAHRRIADRSLVHA